MRRALGSAILALLAASCGRGTPARSQCQVDDQCGVGFACLGGGCIARATAPASWAVELEPRVDSQAALTDLAAVSATGGLLALTAGAKVSVIGTLASPANAPGLTSAHVVADVPSAIAGRPDLQFAADLAVSVDATAVSAAPEFTLMVPEDALGRPASVQFVPVAPQDAAFAPLAFAAALRSALSFGVPASYLVRGRFFDALRQPLKGFLARVFRDGQLVSSVGVTDDAGAFSLSVPITTIASDPLTPLSVELKPIDPAASIPRFSTALPMLGGSIDLGSLYQAAFITQPNVFRVTVHGETDKGPLVVGAIVRARTVLAQDQTTGTTDFLRDARTDSTGGADISLLPGTASSARAYAIAVIPPPESTFGILCVDSLPILAGGSAVAPANLQPMVVLPRPAMTGMVLDAAGQPVAGVVVAATRTGAGDGTACNDAVGSPPANANTDSSGRFRLLLDPGTYQLDYDPPAGSPVPRFTETGVRIASNLDHSVQLHPGGLVEGDAVGPDGSPLPSAAVRLYVPGASGIGGNVGSAAVLLGQSRTDGRGHFRIVIPLTD